MPFFWNKLNPKYKKLTSEEVSNYYINMLLNNKIFSVYAVYKEAFEIIFKLINSGRIISYMSTEHYNAEASIGKFNKKITPKMVMTDYDKERRLNINMDGAGQEKDNPSVWNYETTRTDFKTDYSDLINELSNNSMFDKRYLIQSYYKSMQLSYTPGITGLFFYKPFNENIINIITDDSRYRDRLTINTMYHFLTMLYILNNTLNPQKFYKTFEMNLFNYYTKLFGLLDNTNNIDVKLMKQFILNLSNFITMSYKNQGLENELTLINNFIQNQLSMSQESKDLLKKQIINVSNKLDIDTRMLEVISNSYSKQIDQKLISGYELIMPAEVMINDMFLENGTLNFLKLINLSKNI